MKYYRAPEDALDLAIRTITDRVEECLFTRVRFFDERGEVKIRELRPEEMHSTLRAYALRYCGRWDCPHGTTSFGNTGHDTLVACPLQTVATFELRHWVDEDGVVEPQYHFVRWGRA